MKNILLVAALAVATTTPSIRTAAACGATPPQQTSVSTNGLASVRFADQVAAFPGAKAKGVWPRVARDGARTILTLSYPQFGSEGPQLYVDSFEVVRDRNLRRLERVLARTEWPNLDVTIERVDGFRWRVTGWSVRS
jgi:hypothetical protein